MRGRSEVTTQTKSIDELVAFVIQHPIRVDALSILNERVASPSEIAKLCGGNLNKVGNHVRALAEAGCIEEVRTEVKRGAVEHFYRASLRPHIGDAEWAQLPEPARREISGLVFQAVIAEGLGALRAGTFDSRTDRHLSWSMLTLDGEGWTELTTEQAESLERIEAIQARSYERMVHSKEEGVGVIAAAMSFERAVPGRSPRPPM
jgi:hypothetical protein